MRYASPIFIFPVFQFTFKYVFKSLFLTLNSYSVVHLEIIFSVAKVTIKNTLKYSIVRTTNFYKYFFLICSISYINIYINNIY